MDKNEVIHKLRNSDSVESFTDKLLGKDIARRIQYLIKKDLNREDLLELLYLLTNIELKLANLSDYDRYLLGKFFAWIRDLVKLGEFLYDYIESIEDETDEETIDILKSIKNMVLHDIKFAVDIYLYLLRSTSGISAFAFDALSKMRYEYEYGGNHENLKPPQEKKSLFFFRK